MSRGPIPSIEDLRAWRALVKAVQSAARSPTSADAEAALWAARKRAAKAVIPVGPYTLDNPLLPLMRTADAFLRMTLAERALTSTAEDLARAAEAALVVAPVLARPSFDTPPDPNVPVRRHRADIDD